MALHGRGARSRCAVCWASTRPAEGEPGRMCRLSCDRMSGCGTGVVPFRFVSLKSVARRPVGSNAHRGGCVAQHRATRPHICALNEGNTALDRLSDRPAPARSIYAFDSITISDSVRFRVPSTRIRLIKIVPHVIRRKRTPTTTWTLLSGLSARALTRHTSVAIVVRSERYQTTHARKPFLTPRSRLRSPVCALWCSTNLMTILGPRPEAVSQSARSCPTTLMRNSLTRGVRTCRHAGCKRLQSPHWVPNDWPMRS